MQQALPVQARDVVNVASHMISEYLSIGVAELSIGVLQYRSIKSIGVADSSVLSE
jgi:hypothetical protein